MLPEYLQSKPTQLFEAGINFRMDIEFNNSMNNLLTYFGSKIQQSKLIQMEDIFQGELEIFDLLLWPIFFQYQFQVEGVNDLLEWLEQILGMPFSLLIKLTRIRILSAQNCSFQKTHLSIRITRIVP